MPSHEGSKKMDLRTLSLNELKKLQNDVAVAIFNFEKRKKAEAVAEIERVAKSSGYSLSELFDENVTSKKPKGAPKYANPADASQTWTGRGSKPKWVHELLASGKSLNDAAI